MAGSFKDCATKIHKPPALTCPLPYDPQVTKDQIICWKKRHPHQPLDIHSIILDRPLDLSQRLVSFSRNYGNKKNSENIERD